MSTAGHVSYRRRRPVGRPSEADHLYDGLGGPSYGQFGVQRSIRAVSYGRFWQQRNFKARASG